MIAAAMFMVARPKEVIAAALFMVAWPKGVITAALSMVAWPKLATRSAGGTRSTYAPHLATKQR